MEDGVALGEVRAHRLSDLGGRFGPDVDQRLVTVLLGQSAELELLLDLGGLALVAHEDLEFRRRGDDVGEGDRDTRPGRPMETVGLQSVQ